MSTNYTHAVSKVVINFTFSAHTLGIFLSTNTTHLTKDTSTLDIYLVGGAVRDKLLNRTVKDNDYLVVGATVEQMLLLGFTQVGKDFPVFLK